MSQVVHEALLFVYGIIQRGDVLLNSLRHAVEVLRQVVKLIPARDLDALIIDIAGDLAVARCIC